MCQGRTLQRPAFAGYRFSRWWPACPNQARLVPGLGAEQRAQYPVARIHPNSRLTIDYAIEPSRGHGTGQASSRLVLNMEVVEHVSDSAAYLTALSAMLKPGGWRHLPTINRNPKSLFAMAIVGARICYALAAQRLQQWEQVHHAVMNCLTLMASWSEPVISKGLF